MTPMHGIDLAACRSIRKALLIGLSSLGEIERVSREVSCRNNVGESIPDGLHPIHPTGTDDTIGNFAEALMYVDVLENELLSEVGAA
jgi:hypothetical protein